MGKLIRNLKIKWLHSSKTRKVVVVFTSFIALLVITIIGYGLYCLNKVKIEKPENAAILAETFDDDSDKITKNKLEKEDEILSWEDYYQDSYKEEGVINILLCGEEKINDNGRGRTDCMILATINNEEKSIKMTSIMRDTYVKIPGYKNNKLNAAYNIGGMPLLQETIETNFGIAIDGYIIVDFNGFKEIVDLLGGVDIELTQKEANYLNSTNYISEKRYRNVKSGVNHMNGTQTLGYTRVRHVATGNGLNDDYGRNYRQRTVLTQIYNEYKTASIAELLGLLPNALKLVTTNIPKSQLISYITTVLSIKPDIIETYKLPMDGTYKGARIRNMAVLYITDMDKLRDTFEKYVFGDYVDESKLTETSDIQPEPINNTSSKPDRGNKSSPTPKQTPKPSPKPTNKNKKVINKKQNDKDEKLIEENNEKFKQPSTQTETATPTPKETEIENIAPDTSENPVNPAENNSNDQQTIETQNDSEVIVTPNENIDNIN